ncbi:HNH endonuclease [Microvirga aerophila]|uniref:HNH endonuclease n=1 Tax=Microvirga aerophila TaxID=670291 RepID=UPI000DEFF4A8
MILNFSVACGDENTDRLEHHHLVPRSAGRSDDPTNLITLCHSRHGKAHGMVRRDFRKLTAAGIARAKANGKKPGNPRLLARDPNLLRELGQKKRKHICSG